MKLTIIQQKIMAFAWTNKIITINDILKICFKTDVAIKNIKELEDEKFIFNINCGVWRINEDAKLECIVNSKNLRDKKVTDYIDK